jgi:hypothetical protein
LQPSKAKLSEERKRFFLKKEAKTFANYSARSNAVSIIAKVFWFFFSKKNRLLFTP